MIDAAVLARCAALIRAADGLVVTAGAGMGVDSGLPDFRGPGGFWGVYPALGRARIRFEAIASPAAFDTEATLAWGFYGHRLNLYRRTEPHAGFGLLRAMAAGMEHGAFVFTSNVDGQFQKAGFEAARVVECHGSIHYLQCTEPCSGEVWPADGFDPVVDEDACRITSGPPACPACGRFARPNILMFGDWGWIEARTAAQMERFRRWRSGVARPVVIEIGAGTAIPSVRLFGEEQRCPLIRLNPGEPRTRRAGDVGIAAGGLAGLQAIAAALGA